MRHFNFQSCMRSLLIFLLFIAVETVQAQKSNLIYVDAKGVIRYTATKKEAAFFGVNYTVPFAYGYRSHLALGVDPEKAIDADVYHLARLGLDAFRVHMWDVELSDSVGHLQKNEHLRLFDYLLKKLKEQHIKILITPIAFWGNGYPERDQPTNGFSSVYGKQKSVVLDASIKAQEQYLKEVILHVNPYTGLSYLDDPDIIALEINNEPHHSGPKSGTTDYVNRLAAAVRTNGWTKPVFYNISESPTYADAVAASNVNGFSFQWYPTGLVAGHEQKGNYLPHVDEYFIPFIDTIKAFQNRPLMVYEFDAGDVLQPLMYPAMARSFRTAGFQWATQFAYDPMATAYANTEYQTHYLNLAYTPAKAISFLIASEVFHSLPRSKSFGKYPADTSFDSFRLSYREQLSEMNRKDAFYYSGNTATSPLDISQLKKIAGTGSSAVVEYEGTGAYFLDQLKPGLWRLELMPDAVSLSDPFARASPKKQVTAIAWTINGMRVKLPDLGNDFQLISVTEGNKTRLTAVNGSISIGPGIYLFKNNSVNVTAADSSSKKFYAPAPTYTVPVVVHQEVPEYANGQPLEIKAKLINAGGEDQVSLAVHHSNNTWKTIPMKRGSSLEYSAALPEEMRQPGMIDYRIMVKKSNGSVYTFPGGQSGDPYAWDYVQGTSWQSMIALPGTPLSLFDPLADQRNLTWLNTDWNNNRITYTASERPGALNLVMSSKKSLMACQLYAGDLLKQTSGLEKLTSLVIRARLLNESAPLRITLVTNDAVAFSTSFQPEQQMKEFIIPLNSLQRDSFLLLPRPYPGFQPLKFRSDNTAALKVEDLDRWQLQFQGPATFEIEFIQLR
jgi:hypothetical protein